ELVLTAERSDGSGVVAVFNVTTGPEDQVAYLQAATDYVAWRMTTGDLDGDGVDEIVTLTDRGYYDSMEDDLEVFVLEDDGLVSQGVGGIGDWEAIDIEAGDLDASGTDALAVTTDDAELHIVTWQGGARWDGDVWNNTATSSDTLRLAMQDYDSDAPMAVLTEGPVAQRGSVVPLAALH
ncbi:MAG: hypothetical protein GY884_33860, partial [Proteobacteria bacterium]|nr:hypothetical protein [Pseudomonadota bacterium]